MLSEYLFSDTKKRRPGGWQLENEENLASSGGQYFTDDTPAVYAEENIRDLPLRILHRTLFTSATTAGVSKNQH